MRIKWLPEMSVQVKTIDAQHQIFISIMNELLAAEERDAVREETGAVLNQLTSYAFYHFATEEKYFALFNYEGAAEHIIEHNKLKDRVHDFNRRYFDNGEDVAEELVWMMADWLVNHLETMDKKYVKCFKEHGLL